MNEAIKLDWDSEFFGFPVGKVLLPRLDGRSARRIEDWARSAGIRLLYFEAPADDRESVRAAENGGYTLVDVRTTLGCRIDSAKLPLCPPNIRSARGEDLPALEKIAGNSFLDSRFYFDERFDREVCSEFYRTWIRESTRGFADAVFVYEHGGEVGGFVTCHADPEAGRIGLICVGSKHQGLDIGAGLVNRAIVWTAERGLDAVRVITQGRNVAAQRLFQRCGLRTESIGLFYHRWFEDSDQ